MSLKRSSGTNDTQICWDSKRLGFKQRTSTATSMKHPKNRQARTSPDKRNRKSSSSISKKSRVRSSNQSSHPKFPCKPQNSTNSSSCLPNSGQRSNHQRYSSLSHCLQTPMQPPTYQKSLVKDWRTWLETKKALAVSVTRALIQALVNKVNLQGWWRSLCQRKLS